MKSILFILIAAILTGCSTTRVEVLDDKQLYGTYVIEKGSTKIIHKVWIRPDIDDSQKKEIYEWAKSNLVLNPEVRR